MQQAAKKSSAPVLPLKDHSLFRQQCYINGKWVDADSGKTVDVVNPATDEVLGTVPNLGAAETRRAIDVTAVERVVFQKAADRGLVLDALALRGILAAVGEGASGEA